MSQDARLNLKGDKMQQSNSYKVRPNIAEKAHIDEKTYKEMYERSINDPEAFWAEQAHKFISWNKTWDRVKSEDFENAHVRWFEGAKLNVCYNCVDRHVEENGEKVAIIWEGDDPWLSRTITYNELLDEVSRFANVLKSRGVKKGDRVAIYLPMIPEAATAMLACARIGAVHSVVFGGFSPEALKERINDSDCKVVITADEGVRSGKFIPLKLNVDKALRDCPNVHTTIVINRCGADITMLEDRDIWYHEAIKNVDANCPPVEMDAEDPLFILYTSGSTGRPKGVLHTTGGYILYAAITHKYVFDYHPEDIYWCTADVGWVTGHSYIVYGPLANNATTLMFEGTPTYPSPARFWQIVDKHQVTIFYTAPTAIRALMSHGYQAIKGTKRDSLRILGTVGEPINPEAWIWYYETVGEKRCPVVDTWWQTETGGILISPLPGCTELKPGSATRPFFGIVPQVVDEEGNVLEGEQSGHLVIKNSWPGQMRTVYGDHQRFIDTYFKTYPGKYFTGDGVKRDKDGDYWITGRVDDVINVSGHRIGTAEVESALIVHSDIAEAAVVGYPHPIKGQGIYAFVTPMQGVVPDKMLEHDLVSLVRGEIGSFATPDIIHWSVGLPKTRSGKIMRRILRKLAAKDYDNMGDISTLADPGIVKQLTDEVINLNK